MSLSGYVRPKAQVKAITKALVEAEKLVSNGFGDLDLFPNECVESLANVSKSKRKRDKPHIQYVVGRAGLEFCAPEEKGKSRITHWTRDAVIIYRAFVQIMTQLNYDRAYRINRRKWLPLIAITYVKRK